MEIHKKYLLKTISLAKLSNPSPNPRVGAIIVKNNKIIGKGYHKGKGLPHAEIEAINNAGDVRGATLYVNLEPCCHYGETKPCTKEIINAGIKEVHIGCIDISPWVNGKGIEELKSAGINVVVHNLEEAKELNAPYFKWIKTGLPYVILKAAITLDGKIADLNGNSKWITNIFSRKFVHKLRASVDAVMVGINTIIKDDPELTVRYVRGKNPKRIILDTNLIMPPKAKVLGTGCIIATSSEKNINGAEIWRINSSNGLIDIFELLKFAGKNKIQSILIEGGKTLFTTAIKSGIVDKFYIFISPKILGNGIDFVDDIGIKNINEAIKLTKIKIKKFDTDILIEGIALL